jgi:hypothetical protein
MPVCGDERRQRGRCHARDASAPSPMSFHRQAAGVGALRHQPERVAVANVVVEIAPLGKGCFERGEGLNRYVQKLIVLPGDYKPDRENPGVRVIVELAYRGRRHVAPGLPAEVSGRIWARH